MFVHTIIVVLFQNGATFSFCLMHKLVKLKLVRNERSRQIISNFLIQLFESTKLILYPIHKSKIENSFEFHFIHMQSPYHYTSRLYIQLNSSLSLPSLTTNKVQTSTQYTLKIIQKKKGKDKKISKLNFYEFLFAFYLFFI